MTLVEVSLVVGLFGFIALLMLAFFPGFIDETLEEVAGSPERRAATTVEEVHKILAAARLYHARNDAWPTWENRAGTKSIHIGGLLPNYLEISTFTPYTGCGENRNRDCTGYTLQGWKRPLRWQTFYYSEAAVINFLPTDSRTLPGLEAKYRELAGTNVRQGNVGSVSFGRGAVRNSGTDGKPTLNPDEADDLVLLFGVPRRTSEDVAFAERIIERIPLGYGYTLRDTPNEILIEARIHGVRARPSVRLVGEDRPVVFDEGDLQEVFRLTRNIEDLATPQRVTGPAISLMPIGDRGDSSGHARALRAINNGQLPEHEVFIGTNEVTAAPSAYLRMQRPDAPCRPHADNCPTITNPRTDARAIFGVRPTSRVTHNLVFGITDGDRNTNTSDALSLQLRPFVQSNGTSSTPLTMQLVRKPSGTTNDDAYWDIFLSPNASHRSLQARLCALENFYTGEGSVAVDCSCPGDTTSCP